MVPLANAAQPERTYPSSESQGQSQRLGELKIKNTFSQTNFSGEEMTFLEGRILLRLMIREWALDLWGFFEDAGFLG